MAEDFTLQQWINATLVGRSWTGRAAVAESSCEEPQGSWEGTPEGGALINWSVSSRGSEVHLKKGEN